MVNLSSITRAAVGLPLLMTMLVSCGQARNAEELRLKHEVTIATANGDRTFSSVVSLAGYQNYNRGFGGSGWGAITCRLTGAAIRISVGDHDFYVPLTGKGEVMPAWYQVGLVKKHFGIPNYDPTPGWIVQWNQLAASNRAAEPEPDELSEIVVVPRNGWMNDARLIDIAEAKRLGLEIRQYRIEVTRDKPIDDVSVRIRYRPNEASIVGRERLVVEDAAA